MKIDKIIKSTIIMMLLVLGSSFVKVNAQTLQNDFTINECIQNNKAIMDWFSKNDQELKSIINEYLINIDNRYNLENKDLDDNQYIEVIVQLLLQLEEVDLFDSESLKQYLEQISTNNFEEFIQILHKLDLSNHQIIITQ